MSGIYVLEEKHMISIMLFLRDNDGRTKTDLYRAVSTNPRMPEKLDRLESVGLVVQEPSQDSNAVRLHLTDVGKKVSDLLAQVDRAMTV